MRNYTQIFFLILFGSSITFQVRSQSLCFDAASDTRYETAFNCDRIAVLDLNNDSHLDVIGVTDGSGLSVHLGLGDGTFNQGYVEENYGGRDIALADFNNDGFEDLVRLGSGGFLTVHLNDGAGAFDAPSSASAIITSGNYRDLAAGDVTGDGNADAVAVDYDGDRIFVFEGDGAGNIQMVIVIQTANEPCKVAVGDLNGDDVEEIACTYGAIAQASVFYNDGMDSFDEVILNPQTFAGPQIASLTIDDVNGDGHGDVLIGGLTMMHLFIGDANFDFSMLPDVGMGSYAYAFITGDWDNDGDKDPAWANDNTGGITIQLNNGDGTFPAYGTKFFSANGSTGDAEAGDFNEDGNPDIITATGYPGFFTFMEGHGDGRFGSLSLLTGFGASGLCVADFDQDGDADVIGTNAYFTQMALSRNNGAGLFSETEYFSITPYSVESSVAGDFDEDGFPDVAGHGSFGFVIALNNNGNSFDSPAVYPSTVATGGGERTLAIGYFDADDHLDLAGTYLNTDELAVVFGNGDGTFSAPLQLATGEYPRSLFSGDLNADGYDDIAAVANTNDELWVYFSTGNGGFQSVLILATGLGPQGITAFDANEDGMMDLFVGCPNENHVYMYPGNNGSFAAPQMINIPTQSNAGYFNYADINADGHLDLLAAFYQIHYAGVFFGNGDGTFQDALQFDCDQFPTVIIPADFNSDGAIDMTTLNSVTNNISVILNNSAFVSASGPLAFCNGETVTLTASDGYSYQWNNTEASQTQSIVVSEAGNYFCAITNQSGTCTLITPEVEVEVFQSQTVTLNLDSSVVCLESGEFYLTGGQPFGGVYSGSGVAAGQFDPTETGAGTFTISYSYEDAGSCTSASATDEITVEICNHVINEMTEQLLVYPAITDELVRFSGPLISRIEVRSIDGKYVGGTSMSSSQGELSLKGFSKGIYLLTFYSSHSILTHRIVLTE
jgi:large repetitive protein